MNQSDTQENLALEPLVREVDRIHRERRERGQLPTWYRRRDARAEMLSKFTGSRGSDRHLRRVETVITRGCPELVKAMDARLVSVAAAAELSALPRNMQVECLSNPALRKAVLRELRGP